MTVNRCTGGPPGGPGALRGFDTSQSTPLSEQVSGTSQALDKLIQRADQTGDTELGRLLKEAKNGMRNAGVDGFDAGELAALNEQFKVINEHMASNPASVACPTATTLWANNWGDRGAPPWMG